MTPPSSARNGRSTGDVARAGSARDARQGGFAARKHPGLCRCASRLRTVRAGEGVGRGGATSAGRWEASVMGVSRGGGSPQATQDQDPSNRRQSRSGREGAQIPSWGVRCRAPKAILLWPTSREHSSAALKSQGQLDSFQTDRLPDRLRCGFQAVFVAKPRGQRDLERSLPRPGAGCPREEFRDGYAPGRMDGRRHRVHARCSVIARLVPE